MPARRRLHSHDAVAARGADGGHRDGRGRQQYKSRVARGAPEAAGRPGAKISQWRCLVAEVLGAAGPGARARGRRRRAAVPVGPQEAGLSGWLEVGGDTELARAAAIAARAARRAARRGERRAAAGPARRRGAVADLRRFKSALRGRVRRVRLLAGDARRRDGEPRRGRGAVPDVVRATHRAPRRPRLGAGLV